MQNKPKFPLEKQHLTFSYQLRHWTWVINGYYKLGNKLLKFTFDVDITGFCSNIYICVWLCMYALCTFTSVPLCNMCTCIFVCLQHNVFAYINFLYVYLLTEWLLYDDDTVRKCKAAEVSNQHAKLTCCFTE